MIRLDSQNLLTLDPRVSVPSYDRDGIRTGIVHFGVGGFHRAHQARYLDLLLELGAAREWGICGVGVLPGDRRMRDVMTEQDCLYTLTATGPDGVWDTRVVGSIVEYLYAPDDPEAVVAKLAAADTRFVSLTITEGGYNSAHPSALADLSPGAPPTTVFGLVTAALARRRALGLAPFTIMSCDNIEGNGHIARAAFTDFAARRDPALAEWISREGAFPNSMVDRITPATDTAAGAELAERFGIADAWPVRTEPFTQWVLEDDFALGRPEFEKVGVQLVADVAPYELMKLRLLNGGHQALAYLGYLSGHRLVHDAAQDPVFAEFLRRYLDLEATPTLLPVPGIDLDAYKGTLLARFRNPTIADTLARLCADASERIPRWLLPVVQDRLQHGGEIDCVAIVVAAWARYCEGYDEAGEPIEIIDRRRDHLITLAAGRDTDPPAFLSDRSLFGDLSDNPRFVTAYRAALDNLHSRGARATAASTGLHQTP